MKNKFILTILLTVALTLSSCSAPAATDTPAQPDKPEAEPQETAEEPTEPMAAESSEEAGNMPIRGMNYDAGIEFGSPGAQNNSVWDEATTRREMEIIHDDLHCNAVRVSGTQNERMLLTAELALSEGMDVWLSPHYIDYTQDENYEKVVECAGLAQTLQDKYPDNELVYIIGCEFPNFLQGIISDEATFTERLSNPDYYKNVTNVKSVERLNTYMKKVVDGVREVFNGRVTYCATTYEDVDWSIFDIIGLDHYRASYNKSSYAQTLLKYAIFDKPIVVTEVGLCCYTGAAALGSAGYNIVAPEGNMLNGVYERNETEQATELKELLTVLNDETDAEGAFVFTFVYSDRPTNDDPLYDMDMSGFSIVKSYTDKNGAAYPDMKWEPKEAFYAVEEFFGGIE